MKRVSIKFRVTAWFTLIMLIISIVALCLVVSVSRNAAIRDTSDKLTKMVDDFDRKPPGSSPGGRDGKQPDKLNIDDAGGSDPGQPPADAANTMPDIPGSDPNAAPGSTPDPAATPPSEQEANTAGSQENAPAPDASAVPDMGENSQYYGRGVHLALYDSDHNVVAGVIPYDFADSIKLENGMQEITSNGEKFLVYVKQSSSDSNWIVGASPVTDESQILSDLVRSNAALALILVIVAAAGGYLILRRAFKPVDRITRTAAEISDSSDLTRRINLGSGNDEIYRLAATFDKMLDKIEDSMENEKQFTSDASHELRTPVAVITSECEYALDCADTLDDAKESIATIRRQTDRMSKLISELLTISRLDRDTQKVVYEEIELSELLSFVCDEQEEIHDSSRTLVRCIQPNITISSDRTLLMRLFINLIGNAYQYTDDGGKITVTLESDDDSVMFSVMDDGIGIAEKDLPKIWKRFYQANPSRTNENGSMGLGLSMVKRIADCLGGIVSVTSEQGKGSKFTFVLKHDQN